ncbi:MAG: WXG100 family type VII secretion target, partial [Brevibacterium aurantiacum]|nr:WXG100 family type VII secretion target [Brevibacterium aurantiacum]
MPGRGQLRRGGVRSGHAAQNFQTVINEWEGAQKQLLESLTSIHGALNTAAAQYSEVEAANSRLFAP